MGTGIVALLVAGGSWLAGEGGVLIGKSVAMWAARAGGRHVIGRLRKEFRERKERAATEADGKASDAAIEFLDTMSKVHRWD